MIGRRQLILVLTVNVLALFIGNGASGSTCPNGMTNITASSGSLKYPESGTYGKNETKCWSITIPDTYFGILFRFSSLDIEMCSNCECDFVQYSPSESILQQGIKYCGRYSYNFLHEYLLPVVGSHGFQRIVPGSTFYFRFVSDDSAHYKGFHLNFIALSSYEGEVNYLNASDGETITFGTPKVGIQNYPSNYKERWFLIVPEGQQVQIDFDTFNLEDSKDCRNDYVEFREAFILAGDPGVISGYYGPILTNRLCGNTKPSSIQSKGNMVWVQFMSDRNSITVYKGFKASFKAGQGRLSVSCPLTLLFLSALIVDKINLF